MIRTCRTQTNHAWMEIAPESWECGRCGVTREIDRTNGVPRARYRHPETGEIKVVPLKAKLPWNCLVDERPEPTAQVKEFMALVKEHTRLTALDVAKAMDLNVPEVDDLVQQARACGYALWWDGDIVGLPNGTSRRRCSGGQQVVTRDVCGCPRRAVCLRCGYVTLWSSDYHRDGCPERSKR